MLQTKFVVKIIAVFVLSFSIFIFAKAQILTPYTIQDAKSEVNFYVNPEYPKPGEDFTIKLESYALNLRNSTVTFFRNNEKVSEGKGLSEVEFTDNPSGVITISILIDDGEDVYRKDKTIIPGSVDILWQANTYTPPFYTGKSLYSDQSSISTYALANLQTKDGTKIDENSISFEWSVNGTRYGDESGLGKSTFTFNENILDSRLTISVVAQSADGISVSSNSIEIPINSLKLLFYKEDSLYGTMWNKSIFNIKTSDREFTLKSTPFFISSEEYNNQAIEYRWVGNRENIDQKSNILTIRNGSGSSGLVNLNLYVKNTKKLFQQVQKSFRIDFEI